MGTPFFIFVNLSERGERVKAEVERGTTNELDTPRRSLRPVRSGAGIGGVPQVVSSASTLSASALLGKVLRRCRAFRSSAGNGHGSGSRPPGVGVGLPGSIAGQSPLRAKTPAFCRVRGGTFQHAAS